MEHKIPRNKKLLAQGHARDIDLGGQSEQNLGSAPNEISTNSDRREGPCYLIFQRRDFFSPRNFAADQEHKSQELCFCNAFLIHVNNQNLTSKIKYYEFNV
jgi:hypothetical protein